MQEVVWLRHKHRERSPTWIAKLLDRDLESNGCRKEDSQEPTYESMCLFHEGVVCVWDEQERHTGEECSS